MTVESNCYHDSEGPCVTVSICSRNRHADVERCLRSLSLLSTVRLNVIVIDNQSSPPLSELATRVASELRGVEISFRRMEEPLSPNASRNLIAREAIGEYLLSIDDDAYLRSSDGIMHGIKILERDQGVGAIAFPQATSTGELPVGQAQASPCDYDCYTCGFGAYAALIRREAFLQVGGYREICWATGEEQDLCKRMLDKGFAVVAVPQRCIVHEPSYIGRDELRRLRYGIRNNWIDALCNEPWVLLIPWSLKRLVSHHALTEVVVQYHKIERNSVFRWVVAELWKVRVQIWRQRRALQIRTYIRWQRLKREFPAYSK